MLIQGELTYGKIGEWRFDKRSYLRGPPPKNLTLPPPGVPESVVCALFSDACIIYIIVWSLPSIIEKKLTITWNYDEHCEWPLRLFPY